MKVAILYICTGIYSQFWNGFYESCNKYFLKDIADKFGFASDMKAYKKEPEKYNGNVSDIAEIIRIAITGRANTPDLWAIVHVMGEEQMAGSIREII